MIGKVRACGLYSICYIKRDIHQHKLVKYNLLTKVVTVLFSWHTDVSYYYVDDKNVIVSVLDQHNGLYNVYWNNVLLENRNFTDYHFTFFKTIDGDYITNNNFEFHNLTGVKRVDCIKNMHIDVSPNAKKFILYEKRIDKDADINAGDKTCKNTNNDKSDSNIDDNVRPSSNSDETESYYDSSDESCASFVDHNHLDHSNNRVVYDYSSDDEAWNKFYDNDVYVFDDSYDCFVVDISDHSLENFHKKFVLKGNCLDLKWIDDNYLLTTNGTVVDLKQNLTINMNNMLDVCNIKYVLNETLVTMSENFVDGGFNIVAHDISIERLGTCVKSGINALLYHHNLNVLLTDDMQCYKFNRNGIEIGYEKINIGSNYSKDCISIPGFVIEFMNVILDCYTLFYFLPDDILNIDLYQQILRTL